jgi:hypothetical protein
MVEKSNGKKAEIKIRFNEEGQGVQIDVDEFVRACL